MTVEKEMSEQSPLKTAVMQRRYYDQWNDQHL